MYDGMKIIPGILLFVILLSFPVWYDRLNGSPEISEPELLSGKKYCVMPKGYMRANHMVLLNEWRDTVIRDGNRSKVTSGNDTYDKSLSKSCMKCHSNKTNFCDRCHGRLNVNPACWDCHNPPEESTHAN